MTTDEQILSHRLRSLALIWARQFYSPWSWRRKSMEHGTVLAVDPSELDKISQAEV